MWKCRSCGKVWQDKPFVSLKRTCPNCGSGVYGKDLSINIIRYDPRYPDGFEETEKEKREVDIND